MWDTYQRDYGQDASPVLVWRAASQTMKPTIPDAVIQAALARDEPAARAEWLAEFRDDVSALVTHARLAAVVAAGRTSLPPEPAVEYAAFTDVSTGSGQDSMCLAIAHADRTRGRVVIDHVEEIRPPYAPDVAAGLFADLLHRCGLGGVVGDRFAFGWVGSTYEKLGVRYHPSELTRSELYAELLIMINSGQVELPDLPRLLEQLAGLQRRPGSGGRDSIDHPAGKHDDLANVVAGTAALAARRLRGAPALQIYAVDVGAPMLRPDGTAYGPKVAAFLRGE